VRRRRRRRRLVDSRTYNNVRGGRKRRETTRENVVTIIINIPLQCSTRSQITQNIPIMRYCWWGVAHNISTNAFDLCLTRAYDLFSRNTSCPFVSAPTSKSQPPHSCGEIMKYLYSTIIIWIGTYGVCEVRKTKGKYKLDAIFFRFIIIIKFHFRLRDAQRETRVLCVANIYRLPGR